LKRAIFTKDRPQEGAARRQGAVLIKRDGKSVMADHLRFGTDKEVAAMVAVTGALKQRMRRDIIINYYCCRSPSGALE
jgi:hypothetical protein